MSTYTYDIVVMQDSQELGSGVLTVDTSTTQPTGTFTPEGGTAVSCTIGSWSSNPNATADFSFTLTASNGDFPVPPDTPSVTYEFVGTENNAGTDPSGTVDWPQDDPRLKDVGGDPPVWQGDATVDPKALGQGAK